MAKWKLKIVKFNQKYKLKSIFKTWRWKERGKNERFCSLFIKTCYWSHMADDIDTLRNWKCDNEKYIIEIHLLQSTNSKRIEYWASNTFIIYLLVYISILNCYFSVERCTHYMNSDLGENWSMNWKYFKVFVGCFVPMVREHCKCVFRGEVMTCINRKPK